MAQDILDLLAERYEVFISDLRLNPILRWLTLNDVISSRSLLFNKDEVISYLLYKDREMDFFSI